MHAFARHQHRHSTVTNVTIPPPPRTTPSRRATPTLSAAAPHQVLTLPPGKHQVAVQWRKWGTHATSWRNNPAMLDGFASSRFLAVLGGPREEVTVGGGVW